MKTKRFILISKYKEKIFWLCLFVMFVVSNRAIAVCLPQGGMLFDEWTLEDGNVNKAVDAYEYITIINEGEEIFIAFSPAEQTKNAGVADFPFLPLPEDGNAGDYPFALYLSELIAECQYDFLTPSDFQLFSPINIETNLRTEFIKSQNSTYGFYREQKASVPLSMSFYP